MMGVSKYVFDDCRIGIVFELEEDDMNDWHIETILSLLVFEDGKSRDKESIMENGFLRYLLPYSGDDVP